MKKTKGCRDESLSCAPIMAGKPIIRKESGVVNAVSIMNETHAKIISFVNQYTKKHGYAPSYREIGEGIGLKSPATVMWHLHRMKALGLVDFKEQIPRSLHITMQPGGASASAKK